MQRAYGTAKREMPDVRDVPVSSADNAGLSGVLMPMPKNALAATNPFTGSITYSPPMMQGQGPTEMANTMAHELTHARQAQRTPWYQTALDLFKPDVRVPEGIAPTSVLNNPYYWRPNELEAFQTERNRQLTQPYPVDPVYGSRDIPLPRKR